MHCSITACRRQGALNGKTDGDFNRWTQLRQAFSGRCSADTVSPCTAALPGKTGSETYFERLLDSLVTI
jgi:hypothetical protein